MIEGDTVLVVHTGEAAPRRTSILGTVFVYAWFLFAVAMVVLIGFVTSSFQEFLSAAVLPLGTIGVVVAILIFRGRSSHGPSGDRAAIVANAKGDVVTLRQPHTNAPPVQVPLGAYVEFHVLPRTETIRHRIRDYVEVTVRVQGVVEKFAVYGAQPPVVARQMSAGLAALGILSRELTEPIDAGA